MDDIESGYTSLETINETKWIEGTMEELNAVNAYDPILYMDLDSFSSNSYWVYAQPTDSVVGASTINALGIDTFLITYILFFVFLLLFPTPTPIWTIKIIIRCNFFIPITNEFMYTIDYLTKIPF